MQQVFECKLKLNWLRIGPQAGFYFSFGETLFSNKSLYVKEIYCSVVIKYYFQNI